MDRAKRLYVVSLGCPKNLVDTEAMLGRAVSGGFQLEADPKRADAILINTCSFIEPSRQESMEVIEECLKYKRRGKVRAVIVAGCMAESHRELLEEEFPQIDAFLGLRDEASIVESLKRLLPGGRARETRPSSPDFRLLLTPPHTAYLRIADGCDHTCGFCIIPRIRGPRKSRPMEEIVSEAEQLAASGVRELNLIAQDTTAYGRDLTASPCLADLLVELNQVEGLDWIRVLYAFPTEIDDRYIAALTGLDKVVPYVDVPFQHASERVLQAMRRPASRRHVEGLVERLRARVPGLSLRSTFIVGFPGETEEDFQRLWDFCAEAQFDHAGCFIYSHEPLSRAAELTDLVPSEVQQERQERLLELLEECGSRRAAARVDSEAAVLIDGESDVFPDYLRGRHPGQAPDIDGVVYVPRDAGEPGDLVRCRLTAREGYDLFAEPL